MQRRLFLVATSAAALLARLPAYAAASADDARGFISGLGADAISSLTGAGLSETERETRFRALLVAHFDMPGIAKFVLGRYWKLATDDQKTEFQKLLETLLVQSYAKAFAHYSGEKFSVENARANDDGSLLVNSVIDRTNGDVIHLDWRVEDQENTMRITDLLVEGVSLRTTHRSDFASAIQSNGGTVAGLLDALRQKTSSQ
jgi:phospholipid transport system substrate-binding protein